MANLIYTAIASVDGYIEDAQGNFDWAMPDEEVHRLANDLDRQTGTHLYGRRMYETMQVWETDPSLAEHSPVMRDYAQVWQSLDKIVYSRTLQSVSTRRTRIEREFDPAALRRLKETAAKNISIGGPDLAAHAFRAGLVDEIHLFLFPVVVGGGKPALPHGVKLELSLLEERRFASGVVYLHYHVS